MPKRFHKHSVHINKKVKCDKSKMIECDDTLVTSGVDRAGRSVAASAAAAAGQLIVQVKRDQLTDTS